MTNEEALKVLDNYSSYVDCSSCEHGMCDMCEFGQAQEMARNALKKQIPKKPNKEVDYSWGKATDVNVCPACGYYLSNYEWIETEYGKKEKVTYCDTCGQALDWNE